ncbi:hypothetical protein OTU49_010387 [Cherax quadricarinatus]|uniref:Uncharacterized protein n=1 Tax=Cherax quadricarinatus TaxID=27406 RepID=A0AAW0WJ20_CHEQU
MARSTEYSTAVVQQKRELYLLSVVIECKPKRTINIVMVIRGKKKFFFTKLNTLCLILINVLKSYKCVVLVAVLILWICGNYIYRLKHCLLCEAKCFGNMSSYIMYL